MSEFAFQITSLTKPLYGNANLWRVPALGGTVGRAEHCALVLEDPSRFISREHARVECRGAALVWIDIGTNVSSLNGLAMVTGQPSVLKAGDLIRIGDYLLTLQAVHGGLAELPTSPVAQPLPIFECPGEALNIDDLLADIAPPSASRAEPIELDAPVLAHRFFVGQSASNPEVEPQTFSSVTPQVNTTLLQLASRSLGLPHGHVLSEQELQTMSRLFRLCIQHCLNLLAARRSYRGELGASVTTIMATANNPLKLAATLEEAVGRLLRPADQGYMEADEALVQAFDDILHHMQGSVLDMQKLIQGWRKQLSPQAIEAEMAESGGLTNAVEWMRKAKAWDLYCERYRAAERQWN
ncbi:MAG TPA: type VI secretion system-associated FHA domain protein [Limnobacter sp.]|nr:type VI secretion system-associated FHA domain protein [Limnobacter sp.]